MRSNPIPDPGQLVEVRQRRYVCLVDSFRLILVTWLNVFTPSVSDPTLSSGN